MTETNTIISESPIKVRSLAPWFGEGLESKIIKNQTTGCWEWQRARNKKGYGVCCIKGRMFKAHRLSYVIHVGAIPKGSCLLHSCDNPPCCNPMHLRIGSRAENNRDIIDRGRHVRGGTKTPKAQCKYERGERHHNARITTEIVQQIRSRYANGGCSYSSLAREFGLRSQHVGKIIRKELWVNV